jgi:hypothetical protein
MFFLLETTKSFGAITFGGVPLSHEDDRKEARMPSPTVTLGIFGKKDHLLY